MELFRVGIVARARRRIGDQHDSTVKFRPVVPETVPERWKKYAGFKIEADLSEKGAVKSASLTMPVDKGLIKRVARGREKVASLFTEEQEVFLLSQARRRIDYSKVRPMGPLLANRWKFMDPGLPWRVTGELRKRGDGAKIFEVSIKVPVAQAAAATAGFFAVLAEVGGERDNAQQAKTRWALDYYADQLRKKTKKVGGDAKGSKIGRARSKARNGVSLVSTVAASS